MTAQLTPDPFVSAMALIPAYAGALLGLSCLARAGRAGGRAAVPWWLAGAACVSLANWAPHLADDLLSPGLRLDPAGAAFSALAGLPWVAVGAWVMNSHPGSRRGLLGGVVAGAGALAVHTSGLAAVRLPTVFDLAPGALALGAAVAVLGTLEALRLTLGPARPAVTPPGPRAGARRAGPGLGTAAGVLAATALLAHFLVLAAATVRTAPPGGVQPVAVEMVR
ncbi:hypothetical protein GCM10010123_40700 [Pilimelia anulata]|uniref:MHYT domain-containing protein n=1 Tax=Pilimelia anulata TaxID=53371 RepID=A0A8J3FCP3_9ACTN|nr:hypothetical protein [Pilimelia anulata]GGK06813.1 hypothetical protein GCM10010123_40700 [Pilimelia anulata]